MGSRKRSKKAEQVEKVGETAIDRLRRMIAARVCHDETVNDALRMFVNRALTLPSSHEITVATELVEQAVYQFNKPNKTTAEKEKLNRLLDEIQHKAMALDDPKNIKRRKLSIALLAVAVALTLVACALIVTAGLSLSAVAVVPFSATVLAFAPIMSLLGLAASRISEATLVTCTPAPLAASLLLFRDCTKDTLNGCNPTQPTLVAKLFRPLRVN